MSACKPLLRTIPRQTPTPSLTPLTQCRHESTTRRHKKLLALPQAPSYTATHSKPTLIFNPPSSAPSPFHTPLKFLPQHDSRRTLASAFQAQATHAAQRLQRSHVAAPGTPLHADSYLPPRPRTALPVPVRAPYEKKYHLGEREVREMRELRARDPETWTRVRLAERFGCSQFFVGMVAKAGEKAERVERGHEEVRRRWGQRKREAREDRARRKEMWGRDA
ncbi:mitochondrial ribosomal protein subunit L20-domain-containing protein [Phaeosphaeria sp. MPI-PUGE-AT-0046c]|nr:mitochondrial ribosomal protein subunit L20-domain-containing protein [Phaeosphaeria sp. MPI-PUGE-AT-0046c]